MLLPQMRLSEMMPAQRNIMEGKCLKPRVRYVRKTVEMAQHDGARDHRLEVAVAESQGEGKGGRGRR